MDIDIDIDINVETEMGMDIEFEIEIKNNSILSNVVIDIQAEILSKLNRKELMSYVKSFPTIQLNEPLWQRLVSLAKFSYSDDTLKEMTYFIIYIENLAIKETKDKLYEIKKSRKQKYIEMTEQTKESDYMSKILSKNYIDDARVNMFYRTVDERDLRILQIGGNMNSNSFRKNPDMIIIEQLRIFGKKNVIESFLRKRFKESNVRLFLSSAYTNANFNISIKNDKGGMREKFIDELNQINNLINLY